MPPQELHPDAVKLIARMTDPPPSHARFVGERIVFDALDPLVVGDVWSVAEAVNQAERYGHPQSLAGATAEAIMALQSERAPAFRGPVCRDYLDTLSGEAEKPDAGSQYDIRKRQRRASFVLARCVDLAFDGLASAAERFVATTDSPEMPHLTLALGRFVGGEFETRTSDRLAATLAASPFLVDELRLAASLTLKDNLILADLISLEWDGAEPIIGAPRHRLSDLPRYMDFAETMLRRAAGRVRAIQAGERPYAADKAFTAPEAKVIRRSVRVGLDRDESWLPPILDELFLKSSVAPTAAKTLPSQAVAIALGQAIEAYPTPEAVDSLRKVLRDIRHAGVEKKLQRNLRGAERGLAGRIEIALRLPSDQPIRKAQLTTMKRALEASFSAAVMLNYDDWRMRLAEHPHAKGLAGSLVWRIVGGPQDGIAIMPVRHDGRPALQDVGGGIVIPESDCRLTLWHPADATAGERGAWRDRLVASQIKQPFKQVFREHYGCTASEASTSETEMFSGHAVSLQPFLGLARREGWRIEDRTSIVRAVGGWTARFVVTSEIHPGVTGWTTTGRVEIWAGRPETLVPARFGDLPAAALSEAFRSVDLLVSTSGFAVTPGLEPTPADSHRHMHLKHLGGNPLGPMAEMRKEALKRVLTGRPDMDGLVFDARHLRLGPYAIHLATGRVTRNGDPVTVETPQHAAIAAVPWLPYDEKLLDDIIHTAVTLARIRRDET